MKASRLLIALALVAGCSKRAEKVAEQPETPPPAPAPQVASGGVNSFDECSKFVLKAQPVIEEMTKKAGLPFGNGEAATFVRECTQTTEPREKLMDCVLAAADETAVRACYAAPKP
jgi:hypothetical protein